MGSHSMQAAGLVLFLAGFLAIGAGLAWGASLALILIGLVMVIASLELFRRIKAIEAASSE
jgi:hypothetical protein